MTTETLSIISQLLAKREKPARIVDVLGAKLRFSADEPIDTQNYVVEMVKAEIRFWNCWAENPNESYEMNTARLKWAAPQIMVEMAIPYFDMAFPVIDVGAGTGLVGKLLSEQGFVVNGVDFSKEMLKIAKHRGYRNLCCTDIRQFYMKEILQPNAPYRSLISVGVYGDSVDISWLDEMLKVMDTNAVVAIGGVAYSLNESLIPKLKRCSFKILQRKHAIGHYNHGGLPIEYLYVVAKR